MKRRISVFLLALCMALMLVPAAALAEGDATAASPNGAVYVSASGNDANDGTEAAPYKTIAKAYAEVEDGGTIRLLSDIKTEGKLVLAQGKSVTIEGEAGDGAPVITCAPASSDLYALEVGSERDPEAPRPSRSGTPPSTPRPRTCAACASAPVPHSRSTAAPRSATAARFTRTARPVPATGAAASSSTVARGSS